MSMAIYRLYIGVMYKFDYCPSNACAHFTYTRSSVSAIDCDMRQ